MTTSLENCQATPAFAGIYDVPEAARYLMASPQSALVYPVNSAKLIRWIRRGIASPDLVGLPGNELLIAFEDLVSVRVVAALRATGVGWPEIGRTELWLRERTGAQRPFATEYLWTGQGQIFVDWTERLVSASQRSTGARNPERPPYPDTWPSVQRRYARGHLLGAGGRHCAET